uniref:C-type lectin domain-containing protein n=1 Tax=Macrostomum lignano TaxID=282301 RepID=A0A1I8IFB7_9PLAT
MAWSAQPHYNRKPGDIAIHLDIIDAKPLHPEQLGSRQYFLVSLVEKFAALLQKSDLLRLRRYFCKRGLLLRTTIEGFTDDCLCILCPMDLSGLTQLRSDALSGQLERELVNCFVNPVSLKKLLLKELNMKVRYWTGELDCVEQEWKDGRMPWQFDMSSDEKCCRMLRLARQFQLSRLQHPTAGSLPRLRQLESHFESNLTGLINYAKLLVGGGRLAPLESLAEFRQLRTGRPELARCPDARYADEYLDALSQVGMATDALESGALEPLRQLRVGGETPVQVERRSEIDNLMSEIREVLADSNPLSRMRHEALYRRISTSERALLGGLLSVLPCAVQMLADLDEALDAYFTAGGVHFRPADLGKSCPSSEWIENGAFCYLLVNGTTGSSFDEARTDCQGRANGADSLWISTNSELSWFEDYQARAWNIKKNWAQCTDCDRGTEAAWIGAYRDDLGIFRWIKDSQAVEINLNWYFGQPKDTPLDYVLADDTGSSIRYRTDTREANRKFWHFCKVQHKEPTTPTPMPTTTLPPYLGPCPTRYWTEQGDSCYLLVKGESGRSVDEAEADCSARSSKAGLLWIETADEAAWVMDNSKSTWNLKRDWSQCKDCQSAATAWMSLRRTGDVWTWGAKTGIDQSAVRWFTGHPRATPNDFGSLYDTGNSNDLSVRSETAGSKMWHICKFRFRESTAASSPSASTQPETSSIVTSVPTTTPPYEGACPSSEWIENGVFCYLLVRGATGRSFEEARTDCQSRYAGSDLLWFSDQNELNWFQDYSARQWNIKRDWANCTD